MIVGIAGAVYPDQNITPASSNIWPVANGVDSSQISVTALNSTSGPISGLSVTYVLNRTDLGSMNPTTVITGSNGIATSSFITSTKSGSVLITANISYKYNQSNNNEPYKTVSRSVVQNIDHNTPFRLYKIAPDINGSEVNVGSTVQIIYQLQDIYGNNIDSRKQPTTTNETIKFVIGNAPGPGAVFNGSWNGQSYYSTSNVTLAVNATGYIVVNLTTAQSPGVNTVQVIPQSSIPDSSVDIRGIAVGVPCSITQSVYENHGATPITINPSDPPRLPADGVSEYTFMYNVKDKFGNGIVGTPVVVNVSYSGNISKMTDNNGNAIVYIGPTQIVGLVNISAYTTNASVNIQNQSVWFTSTTPVDMELTANPESMPSRDVKPTFTSIISAKVVDDSGNPVAGQTVNFSLPSSSITYGETYTINSSPKLESYSDITDSDGQATVLFDPGSFTTYIYDKHYDPTATGHCYVNANWTNPTTHIVENRSVVLSWENYPYLSITTSVNPTIVNVSDTVDVTITLKGDGFALQPPPVDVVLVTDLSGSMGNSNKLTTAQAALKQFVGSTNSQIYTGLASFSNSKIEPDPNTVALYNKQLYKNGSQNLSAKPFNPYGSTLDRSYTNPTNYGNTGGNANSDAHIDLNFTQVNSTLNSTIMNSTIYSASGGTDIAGGINAALQMINTKGIAGHNKVIILMSDGIANMAPISPDNLSAYMPGDYNTGGDSSSTAKQAAIAASTKAQSQGVTVYTIGFGSDADTSTLQSMASSGDYYNAPNNSVLSSVYSKIEGQIITQASVNTTMIVDMGTVVIDNITQNNNATNPIFSYEYVPGISTLINRLWYNPLPITPISGYPNSINQSPTYWNINKTLAFNIGTMHLNEEYQATYRLQVLHDGNINLFGPGSGIKFEGAPTMPIPDTYITSSYDLEKLATNSTVDILVTNFAVSDDESGRHFASFNQTIQSGQPTAVPGPTINYIVEMNAGGTWVQIGTLTETNIATEPIYFEILGYIPPGAQLRLITTTSYSSASPEGGQQYVVPLPVYTTYQKAHITLQ